MRMPRVDRKTLIGRLKYGEVAYSTIGIRYNKRIYIGDHAVSTKIIDDLVAKKLVTADYEYSNGCLVRINYRWTAK